MRKNISTTLLAEICGVSQGTVDRALNDRPGISSKTKEKILAAAKEYGYRPNLHARSMAGGKSMLIGVVVFDLKNQYFSELLMALEHYCGKQQYSTVVMFSHKEPHREIECIQNLYHMAVDGIVLCPANAGEEYENFLSSLELPIVTVGNRLERFPHIGIDNTKAMSEVVQLAAENGYEKLIYPCPNLNEPNAFAQQERLNAFQSTARQMELPYEIVRLKNVEAALDRCKKCAIICPTDLYALQLMDLAKQYHAGIIGFDNLQLINHLNLKLDSVFYDIEKTAEQSIDCLLKKKTIIEAVPHGIQQRGSI